VTLPPGLVADPERAEIRGPAEALRALLDSAGDERLDPPLLAAGLQAARAPRVRFSVTGLPEPLNALADERAAALLIPIGGGELALRACTPSGLLGQLVRAVGLRPRPRVTAEAVTVSVAELAQMLADRSADDPVLQEHLDGLVAHWRIEAHGTIGWYLEVLDSERGLWTLEHAGDKQVRLTPTTPTAVLDELAALPGHGGLGPA
jgi:hypothetical protein